MAHLAIAPVLFHLAFPVNNLADTKAYYIDGLGCEPGRENAHCLILKLYGHQLVAHVTAEPLTPPKNIYPRHFGLIFLAQADWQNLRDRVVKNGLEFYQPPRTRFPNTPLEHQTFFLADPFHNLIEIKHYRNVEAIFGLRNHASIGDTSPASVSPCESSHSL